MSHIVLVCSEPFRTVLQGNGIRFMEMATELSREHQVTLWVPNTDIPPAVPCRTIPFPDEAFAENLAGVDAVVVQAHASERYFGALMAHGLGVGPPLVVDLYDPFLINNLRYTRSLGRGIYYRDRDVLLRQLSAGDFFLCSSEGQRMFYVGLLIGIGRLLPEMYEHDRTLRTLIDVVPFGVRPIAPETLAGLPGRIKGVVPGIAPHDVVLFFGGVYDWYDPGLLLDVLADALAVRPNLRVIFSLNPNPQMTPQGTFKTILDRSAAAGWTGRHIFFIPWFPYQERFSYLRDVDLAVCLHEPSLETDLSLRTRLLDYMNAGIPVIATDGGEGERILRAAGAGLLIPPASAIDLREVLLQLLARPEVGRRLGSSGRQWVQNHMSWERSLAPLRAFCAQPRQAVGPDLASAPKGERMQVSGPAPERSRWTVSQVFEYWRRKGMTRSLRAAVRILKR